MPESRGSATGTFATPPAMATGSVAAIWLMVLASAAVTGAVRTDVGSGAFAGRGAAAM